MDVNNQVNNQVNNTSAPDNVSVPQTQAAQQVEVPAQNSEPVKPGPNPVPVNNVEQIPVNQKPQRKNIVLFIGLILFIFSVFISVYFLFLKDFLAKSLKI